MATVQLTMVSERWLDEVVLQGQITDADGERNDNYILPAGLGDVALMELMVDTGPLATVAPGFDLMGVRATIVGQSFNNDIIGVERWTKIGASILSLYISPDPLVLWRQTEPLQLQHPEMDTNAAPTGEIVVRVKVVRVRPIESPARGPIRLVR